MTEILPGIGLETIKFGYTRKDVENVLGPADAVEIFDYLEDGTEIEVSWRYSKLGLTLGFYQDDTFRLGSFDADRPEYTFRGVVFIGRDVNTVEQQLMELGIDDFVYEELTEGLVQIEVDDLSITFFISEGICEEVQWGYLWIDDGTPEWPS